MKKIEKLTWIISLGILCLTLFSQTRVNAQVKKMSSKEMTEASTAVLYGKCKNVKSEWNENHSAIFTYVTITPEEYIKGNLGQEVVVKVPGGKVDDMVYEVSEVPFFNENEDVVAFIWTSPKGNNLITGGFQGKMKIEKDEKTGKRFVEDIDQPDETDIQSQEDKVNPRRVELGNYVSKLKGYMKK